MIDQLAWTKEQIEQYFRSDFPQVNQAGRRVEIHHMAPGRLTMRLIYSDMNLRPGDTVQGPAVMWLSDIAMYAAILAHYGSGGTNAVTTNLSTDFLRRAPAEDLLCDTRFARRDGTLVVCEGRVHTETDPGRLIAVTWGTYFIP